MDKITSQTSQANSFNQADRIEVKKENKFSQLMVRYFTPKESISKREKQILGLLPFGIILILWSILTYSGTLPEIFLPTPTNIFVTMWEMFTQHQFILDIWASFFRVISGYVLAAVIAVPLGILMGSYAASRGFFEPVVGVARYLPVTALIPLFILWMGIGEVEKIAVIFFGTFFPLVFLIMDVSSNVSKDLLNVSYTLGADRVKIFTKVLVPACMPGVVDNLRTVLGWTWTYLVVAELVAAETGIGHVIMTAQRYLHTGQIIAGVIVIGILGFLSDYIFAKAYKKMFPYLSR